MVKNCSIPLILHDDPRSLMTHEKKRYLFNPDMSKLNETVISRVAFLAFVRG